MLRRALPLLALAAGLAVSAATTARAQQVIIQSPITGDSTIVATPLDDGPTGGTATDGTATDGTATGGTATDGTATDPAIAGDPAAQPGLGGETLSPFGLGDEPSDILELGPINEEPVIQPAEIAQEGVRLRALDKMSGELVDFDLAPNQTKQLGRIQVTLGECRYPVDNPTGDAAAFLSIRNAGSDREAFRGWMLASSPALNALDHPRYDVWVLNCITE